MSGEPKGERMSLTKEQRDEIKRSCLKYRQDIGSGEHTSCINDLIALLEALEESERIGGNAVTQVSYMVDEINKAFGLEGHNTPADTVETCRRAAEMLADYKESHRVADVRFYEIKELKAQLATAQETITNLEAIDHIHNDEMGLLEKERDDFAKDLDTLRTTHQKTVEALRKIAKSALGGKQQQWIAQETLKTLSEGKGEG